MQHNNQIGEVNKIKQQEQHNSGLEHNRQQIIQQHITVCNNRYKLEQQQIAQIK